MDHTLRGEILAGMFDSFPSPLLVFDAENGEVLLSNAAAQLDEDLREWLNRNPVSDPQDESIGNPGRQNPFDEVRRTGRAVVLERTRIDSKGDTRTYEVHGYPIFGNGGEVLRVVEQYIDISERKMAEQRILTSEAMFRSFAENAPDYFVQLDHKGTMLFTNRLYEGVSLDDVIGTSIFDWIPRSYNRQVRSAIKRVFDTAKSSWVEYQAANPQGEKLWYSASIGPILVDERVNSVIMIIRDITDRKSLEEKQQRQAHQLGERVKELNCLYGLSRLAVESTKDLHGILTDAVALIPPAWQYPADTCARIIFDGREFRTKNYQETKWKLSSDIVVSGQNVGSVEIHYLKKKPDAFDGPFLREERALVDGFARALSGIIVRTRTAEALRKSELGLARAQHVARIGYWEWNLDSGEVVWADEMYRLFGLDKATYEPTVEGFAELIHPDDIHVISDENITRTVQDRDHELEYRIIDQSSSEIKQIHLWGRTEFDSSGKPVRIIGIMQDITERKRAEEEREKMIDELQDALASVKTLRGLIPICSACKSIRDDRGYWKQVEAYIREHSDATFTHGICPDCIQKLYPEHNMKRSDSSRRPEES